MVIADQKYKYICAITEKCVKRAHEAGHLTLSDKIDRVVTNKYLAIPLFFGLMLLIFYITFGALGANLTDLVDKLINEIFASWVRGGLVSLGASDWAVGLVCDGIIGGVGAVLSFFPRFCCCSCSSRFWRTAAICRARRLLWTVRSTPSVFRENPLCR